MPAPEVMYQYARGAQKGLTATKKKHLQKNLFIFLHYLSQSPAEFCLRTWEGWLSGYWLVYILRP